MLVEAERSNAAQLARLHERIDGIEDREKMRDEREKMRDEREKMRDEREQRRDEREDQRDGMLMRIENKCDTAINSQSNVE